MTPTSQRRTSKSFLTRMIATIVTASVAISGMIFADLGRTSASGRRATVEAAPAVTAPLPFAVRRPATIGVVAAADAVASAYAAVLGLIRPAPVPPGLEQPGSRPIPAARAGSAPLIPAPQPAASVDFDFDGDGKADVARRHPSNSEWKIRNSNGGGYSTAAVGSPSAAIAPGDFDGDGKTDIAVFSAGTWTIRKSSNGQTETVSFGAAGDRPVVGDFDGDLKSDIAVFRPSTNTWWIRQSLNGQTVSSAFGTAGDVTAQGDYDGDGKTDVAVFRPSSGDWHVSGSSAGYFAFHWGLASDIPVPADYDGDSKTDFAVYRGTTGVWYAAKSSDSNNSYFTQYWGSYGDQPVPADYDGDSKADFAVWRPTTGTWYIVNSGTANSYTYETLGVAGDTAVSSAYLKQIGGYIYGYDFAKVRLSPKNATGGTDLYSRNFAWGTSLFGLPGRAGLDAGFGISYNSLVWTKDAATNTVVFNADNSNLTPGFRFGFPTIEPVYYDSATQKFAYLMVTPSGGRAEFRQTTNSNVFETADSSYAQLKINGSAGPNDPADSFTLTVTGTDGTRADYEWKNGAYSCQKITDRNGNYISIDHDANGLLQSVTDTLGRVVTVNYNNEALPVSVTQTWKADNGTGSNVTRTYATFSYTTKEISTLFGNSANDVFAVIGPGNGFSLKVLDTVTFPTETNGAGPSTSFTYNSYGQVWKITNKAADGHTLNYTSVNLPADASTPQTDCPRFTETRNWVENFNFNPSGVEQETVVTNSIAENAAYSVGSHSGTATKIEVTMSNHPHGAVSKTWVGSSGWTEGLTIATEDWANNERKRWTWNQWTQDDTNASFILNPRVTASEVGDTSNRKITEIDYRLIPNTTVAEYGLVSEVRVKDGLTNFLHKKSTTAYNLDTAYVSRRIIGLPSKTISWGYNQSSSQLEKVSEIDYFYDEGDFSDTSLEQNIANVIMHDTANYGASFTVGRGNLTTSTRYDVTGQTAAVSAHIKYNIAGAPVARITPWTANATRTSRLSYADAFNDTPANRNTYAYPTRVYDPAGNYSEVQYRFDTGANVMATSPAPAGNAYGKKATRRFDDFGRIERDSVWKDIQGTLQEYSYSRFAYPDTGVHSKVYSTIVDTDNNGVGNAADEVLSETWTDGAGRVRRSRTPMTWDSNGATLTWSGVQTEYDILGQVKRQSVPSEVNSGWTLQNEDAARGGWLWNSAEYDWKGRVIRNIPSDSTGSDGKDQLISYEGCGCAGGQVTTVQGPVVPRDDDPNQTARRTQKIYQDILGRDWKAETLNWTGGVYSSTTKSFNGLDQPVLVRQFDGTAVMNNPHQTSTMTYDGFGRLKTSHRPEQSENKNTVYNYNPDGSISNVTDARDVVTSYQYNNLGLPTEISYSIPSGSGIPAAATVGFSYDALGNRMAMTDGLGNVQYEYNSLSQMIAETRQFTDSLPQAPTSNNRFKLDYVYSLSGDLSGIKDPYGKWINYGQDRIGRLASVTGTSFADVTNYLSSVDYRAWRTPKALNYGNGVRMEATFGNRLQATDFLVTKTSTSTVLMHKQYEYYNDGNLRYIGDPVTPKFDRLFKYDFRKKLKQTRTGAEARGETEPDETKIPFRENFDFSPFGQLTDRTGDWRPGTACEDPFFTFDHSFVNNRNTGLGFTYDDDGRQTGGVGINRIYNAAGRMTKTFDNSQEYEIELDHEGDGTELKRKRRIWDAEEEDWGDPTIYYYIRSSVLGGQIVSEAKDDGSKRQTFVYASGTRLATQKTAEGASPDEVIWEMSDPSGNSSVNATSSGNVAASGIGGVSRVEADPLGINVNYPCLTNPPSGRGRTFVPYERPNGYIGAGIGHSGECYWDGVPIPCEIARDLLRNSEAIGAVIDFGPLGAFSHEAGVSEQAAYADMLAGYGEDTYEIIRDDAEYSEINIFAGQPIYRIFIDDIKKLPKSLSERKEKLSSDEQEELKKAFGEMLDVKNGDDSCREKLNELLKELGSKVNTIDDLGDSFFNGKNRLYGVKENVEQIRVKIAGKWTAQSAPAGETGWNGSNFEVVVNNRNPKISTVSTFVHEIFHAAGNRSTFDHDKLNTAVRKVIGSTDPIWNLDRFIRKYCSNEGFEK